MDLSALEILALLVGGVFAGIVNTIAGGGSLLTVPMLVMIGLPGTVANGTNRVAVLAQSLMATWRFGAEGVPGVRAALPVAAPLLLGATAGAVGVSMLSSQAFEKLFGVFMVLFLVAAIFGPALSQEQRELDPRFAWVSFLLIGLYGGAVQAGVGVLLVFALSRAGHDLVLSNSIKVVVIALFTTAAVAVFIYQGQVLWLPAILLSVSMSLGAAIGARLAVRGGERLLRPALFTAVIALAGRMLGLY